MVKRYEPCRKWYAFDSEPELGMQEAAYGEYVKLETFEHEMARMQAQVDRMRKEGQRLHEVELTLKSQVNELKAVKSELMGTLKTTGLFLHHCWCDVSMNEYSFEKLNSTMRLVDETIKKHGGT